MFYPAHLCYIQRASRCVEGAETLQLLKTVDMDFTFIFIAQKDDELKVKHRSCPG